MSYKKCTKCGEELPATTEYFEKDSRIKTGIGAQCKVCRSKWRKQYYKDNPQINRNTHYKRTYGITLDKWNDIFTAQHGRCLICGKHQNETKGILHVDHDHQTDEVRGLLCILCNSRLGWYEDHIKEINQYLKGD